MFEEELTRRLEEGRSALADISEAVKALLLAAAYTAGFGAQVTLCVARERHCQFYSYPPSQGQLDDAIKRICLLKANIPSVENFDVFVQLGEKGKQSEQVEDNSANDEMPTVRDETLTEFSKEVEEKKTTPAGEREAFPEETEDNSACGEEEACPEEVEDNSTYNNTPTLSEVTSLVKCNVEVEVQETTPSNGVEEACLEEMEDDSTCDEMPSVSEVTSLVESSKEVEEKETTPGEEEACPEEMEDNSTCGEEEACPEEMEDNSKGDEMPSVSEVTSLVECKKEVEEQETTPDEMPIVSEVTSLIHCKKEVEEEEMAADEMPTVSEVVSLVQCKVLLEKLPTSGESMDTSDSAGLDTVDAAEVTVDAAEVTVDAAEVTVDAAEGAVDAAEGAVDAAEGAVDAAEGAVDAAEGAAKIAQVEGAGSISVESSSLNKNSVETASTDDQPCVKKEWTPQDILVDQDDDSLIDCSREVAFLNSLEMRPTLFTGYTAQMRGVTVRWFQAARKMGYCYYCELKTNKVTHHHRTVHSDKKEVKLINSIESGVKRWRLCYVLQNLGNHRHNSQVIEQGSGEIQVARRPGGPVPAHMFLPCVLCKGYFLRNKLKSHVQRCFLRPYEVNAENAVHDSMILLQPYIADDGALERHILLGMANSGRNTELNAIVLEDRLIQAYGRHQLLHRKRGMTALQVPKIRGSLRGLARLRECINRKTSSQDCFETLLRPVHFSTFAEAMDELKEKHGERLVAGLKDAVVDLCKLQMAYCAKNERDPLYKGRKRAAEKLLKLYNYVDVRECASCELWDKETANESIPLNHTNPLSSAPALKRRRDMHNMHLAQRRQENQRRHWSDEEHAIVRKHWSGKSMPTAKLLKKIYRELKGSRSIQAIRSHLHYLQKKWF